MRRPILQLGSLRHGYDATHTYVHIVFFPMIPSLSVFTFDVRYVISSDRHFIFEFNRVGVRGYNLVVKTADNARLYTHSLVCYLFHPLTVMSLVIARPVCIP